MSYNPNDYPAQSGDLIDEDGSVKNIVTTLGGGTPLSEQVYPQKPAQSGRVIGEDGRLYSLVDLLQNAGGGGGSDVTWATLPGKPQKFPPTEHDHDDRYYTKEQVDGGIDNVAQSLQGKVMAKPDDEPDYLQNKVDGATITVEGSELKAKSLDGLTLTPAQISSLLSGASGNVQSQINDLQMTLAALSAGMRYRGKFEDKATLDAVTVMDGGDLAVVLADETRSGARSIYVYNDDLAVWDFVGAFEFSDAFTALTDTPNNYDDGKVLRSGASGLFYDVVRWSEVADRPDRTKTQIESAVDQAHEHSNKPVLDRIGIDAQGRITIDGVPYVPVTEAKQRLYARRTGSEQSLSAGTDCVFNTKYSGDISYSTSTGVFTLAAGKTYRIMVTASINTTGYVILQLVEADTNAVTSDSNRSIWMDVNLVSSSWHESSAGPLLAYVTPTVTKGYKIRAISVNGTAGLRQNFSALEIMEV